MDPQTHVARWWHKDGDSLLCDLCPHGCRFAAAGRLGRCRVRQRVGGELVSLVYGRPAAVHVDPIEKKPLYHFLPGSWAYSVGTVGCNLSCSFCQNYSLSTTDGTEPHGPYAPPEKIVSEALRARCKSIALTYNEPSIWAEYGFDIGTVAHQKGLKMVSVTNGYIQPAAAEEFYRVIDAANVDLKGFSDDFYRDYCGGRLEPVLAALKVLKRLGVWLEVTNLLIPDANDQPAQIRELVKWVVSELGKETPLHFSAFYPTHRLTDRPCTPRQTLVLAGDIAKEEGLRFVHLGNLHLAR